MIVLIGTYALSTSQATAAGTTASTIALTSSSNPSTYGQPVTLTATVTGVAGMGVPTGTITFSDGGTDLAQFTTLISGAGTTALASITISSLSAGTHTITATYSGDATYNTGSSNTVTQVVNKASTVTTLTPSTSPSVYGQPVTLTATVASTSGTLTGTVTFSDGSTWTDTVTVSPSGEVPSVMISSLSVGSHTITATYNGDANHAGSTVSIDTQVEKQATSTTLIASPSPSAYGQPVTLTATVTCDVGTPTGTITFLDDVSPIGTGTLSGGTAAFTTGALSAGTHTITATYGGDANCNPSTSSHVTQVVSPASTMTTLASSQSPSVYGQPVTFTATVSVVSPGAGTPTGGVTFYDGPTQLGTGTLSGGIAAYTTPSLSAGTHTITATYQGDTNYIASISSAMSQTVDQIPTTVTLASSANPSVYGQSVTFTAAVIGSNGDIPAGTVTFYNGSIPLGTDTLDASGIATLATTSLSAGMNQITATYSGDVNYRASTSDTLQQMVVTPRSPTTPVTIDMMDMYGHAALTPTPTSLPSLFPSLSDATPTPVPTPTSTATTTPMPTQQASTNGDLPVWLILVAIGIVTVVVIGYLFLRRQ